MIAPKARPPLEREIQAKIRLALGSRPDVRLWRQGVGMARTESGTVMRFGEPGQADLSGIVAPWGIRLEVEVKRPGEKPTDAQARWGRMIERFGGIYIVARSAEDAVAQLTAAIQERGPPAK